MGATLSTCPPVIKIRRIFGLVVVTGTPHEIERVSALSGIELSPGDKVTLLPARHHVHRNPRRHPIMKWIEAQGEHDYNEELAHEWNDHYERLKEGSAWDQFRANFLVGKGLQGEDGEVEIDCHNAGLPDLTGRHKTRGNTDE